MEESVRKIIESAYLARLPNKVSNSTIDLITNTTLLRYMQDINFHYDMPGVVIRLQDVCFLNRFNVLPERGDKVGLFNKFLA